jgi:hypothetical protein
VYEGAGYMSGYEYNYDNYWAAGIYKSELTNNSVCGQLSKTVSIPIDLYKSLRGEYFVGFANDLNFGKGTIAWARLYNPPNSGVNLYVNVWTISGVLAVPFEAQFWFNTSPPGTPVATTFVSMANTAIQPPRPSKIQLQYASMTQGEFTGGTMSFVRRGIPEITIVGDENGKFIFPPGGSFLISLSNLETPQLLVSGYIAFGWWEEIISNECIL